MQTKAILIAAGMGSRLRPYTDTKPKCMLEISGKTLLDHAIDAFKENQVKEIAVVRGYKAENLKATGVEFFENHDYESNNILHSLFKAESFMNGPFIASYSDILFNPSVVTALLNSKADIAVVVDRDWKSAYIGRDLHPLSEAEVVTDQNGLIEKIGKGCATEAQATGEFIGMAKFSAKGAEVFNGEFRRLMKIFEKDMNAPFQRAKSFQKAYLTDMFQELVDQGIKVEVCAIHGGWMEIDTPQDYKRAEAFSGETH